MPRIAWEFKQLNDWWELVLRTPEAEGDVAFTAQWAMKRGLKFGNFSYPPSHSFYFCDKTWKKAGEKVLFIQWVVDILTQALQTWHCLNPQKAPPTGLWRDTLPAPLRCSPWEFRPCWGGGGPEAGFWGTWAESPEFKEVFNFSSRLPWLYLAYVAKHNRFMSRTTKVEISKTLTGFPK